MSFTDTVRKANPGAISDKVRPYLRDSHCGMQEREVPHSTLGKGVRARLARKILGVT